LTKPDFSKIWGSGGTLLEISDTNFLEVFAYLGDNPPTVEEFNWLFNRLCLQLQYLNTQGEAFFWQASTAYAVGDIAYSTGLPSWARLECVVAGTTGTTEPIYGITAGVLITDGGVTWIIDDIRDGLSVGRVVGDLCARPGYVKANGATVSRAAYPRLWKFATDNSLTTSDTTTYPGLFGVGDGITTFVLPDWRGVVQRFLDESKGYDSSRVLGTYQSDAIRNITGYMQFRPTAGYNAGGGAIYAENLTNVYDVATSTTANALTQVNFDASRVVPTAAENRMKNIAELAVIRY